MKGTSGESRRQLYDETCMKLYYSVKERNGNVPEECKKLQFSISAIINSGALGRYLFALKTCFGEGSVF